MINSFYLVAAPPKKVWNNLDFRLSLHQYGSHNTLARFDEDLSGIKDG